MGELSGESVATAEYVAKFNLDAFVETGCYLGAGVEYAHSLGLKIYSCDINDEFVADVASRFPDATIIAGESVAVLKELLPKIKDRTLFWLDAHLPNKYRRPWLFTDDNYFPLFDELVAIKEYKENYKYDVIICDDMRNVEAPDNDYFGDGGLPPEAIPARGHTIKEFYDLFSDTHDILYTKLGTGYLVYTPKEVQ